MADRISIIVPTYNRKILLQRLLESFSRLQCSCPLEFIIVDDCSDDGTRAMVEEWKKAIGFADVKYHRLASRSGPARARNAGIVLSTGNILAFTDSDCVADARWVEHLYRQLTKEPHFAGIGGRVLPLHDDIYSMYNTFYRVLESPAHLNAVIGVNCMFHKQPVVDVGMFDDYFFYPGGEEIALCMKLWIRGYRFGFAERGIVYHDYRQNLRDFIRTFYHYGIGEKIILTNRLEEYFRYMHYPEKMHNYIAFKNNLKFQLFFFARFAYGIIWQQHFFLSGLPFSRIERLMLNGLYAIHQIFYHLGRGTFSGIAAQQVRKYMEEHPECVRILDPVSECNSCFLEITDDTIPAVMKPGERKRISVTIKNPSPHLWISADLLISLGNNDEQITFCKTRKPVTMFFFPDTESVYDFIIRAPFKERDYIVQKYLMTREGIPLSRKVGKTIMVSSKLADIDAKIVETRFPQTLVTGQRYQVTINLKNTGAVTWSEDRKIRLGIEHDLAGSAAQFGDYRIKLTSGAQIAPGCEALFSFLITAPNQPGEYTLRYRMVWEYTRWFGEVIEKKIRVEKK